MSTTPSELELQLEIHLTTLSRMHSALSRTIELMDPDDFSNNEIHTKQLMNDTEMIQMLCTNINKKASQIYDSLANGLMHPSTP